MSGMFRRAFIPKTENDREHPVIGVCLPLPDGGAITRWVRYHGSDGRRGAQELVDHLNSALSTPASDGPKAPT